MSAGISIIMANVVNIGETHITIPPTATSVEGIGEISVRTVFIEIVMPIVMTIESIGRVPTQIATILVSDGNIARMRTMILPTVKCVLSTYP